MRCRSPEHALLTEPHFPGISMPDAPSAIEEFRERLDAWKEIWKSVDTRCICFKNEDGWRNVLLHVRLLAGTPHEYEPMPLRYSDERFAIVEGLSDISEFDALLQG